MLEQYDEYLTADETCDLLKMGHNTIYKLLNSGELKAFRNGRTWRIPKESVIEYTRRMAKL